MQFHMFMLLRRSELVTLTESLFVIFIFNLTIELQLLVLTMKIKLLIGGQDDKKVDNGPKSTSGLGQLLTTLILS